MALSRCFGCKTLRLFCSNVTTFKRPDLIFAKSFGKVRDEKCVEKTSFCFLLSMLLTWKKHLEFEIAETMELLSRRR